MQYWKKKTRVMGSNKVKGEHLVKLINFGSQIIFIFIMLVLHGAICISSQLFLFI